MPNRTLVIDEVDKQLRTNALKLCPENFSRRENHLTYLLAPKLQIASKSQDSPKTGAAWYDINYFFCKS